MKKLLEPFGFGQIQDAATLMNSLDSEGFTLTDLNNYVIESKNVIEDHTESLIKKQASINNMSMKCVDCGTSMMLSSVNDRPGNQVGENLKSQWFCTKCNHAQYNKKSVNEILNKRRS